MDELESTAAEMVTFGRTVYDDIMALVVTYAFSFVGAIVILIVGYTIANIVERSIYAALGKFKSFDETLRRFLSKTARYAILVVVGVTVLSQFGVQTASIIAAIGAIGLAIGLALQGTLQNIAAGIMLLVLRPFRVGEFIATPAISGTIEDIGLFATELRGPDGVYVFAPNSLLWNVPITNSSRNDLRRAEITLTVPEGEDAGKVRLKLLNLASEDKRILDKPAPEAFLSTDNAAVVTLHYWTTTRNFWQTKVEMSQKARTVRTELPALPSQ